MNYLAALQELYFTDWLKISVRLGLAISNDNVEELDNILETYFSKPEAQALINGQIAFESQQDDDVFTQSPAFLAVTKSSLRSLEKILQITGNANARGNPDDQESTATLVMYAAELGNAEVVKLLLNYGADINSTVRTSNGLAVTALGQAVSNGYLKLAKLLVENGAEISFGAAACAIESEKALSPILEYFFEQKPDLIGEISESNSVEFQGRTLLHHACGQGNLATVRWLIEKGADINAADGEGFTPRDYAHGAKHEAIEKYLASIGGATKSEMDTFAEPGRSEVTYVEKREITELVDRLELLEEKCGIRLEGVYASCDSREFTGGSEYFIEVNCDIVGTGATLERSISLRLNAYNAAGQLMKTEALYIASSQFSGFESRSLCLRCDQLPHRLRLFPSHSM